MFIRMNPHYESVVSSCFIEEDALLNHVSREIWENPELKHEEKKAHDFLTGVFRDKGFSVTPHYILPTAFCAEFSSNKLKGPTVAFICEYDALPGIGHACGHNLIAESGLGAGLAVKAVMEKFPEVPGKVVVLGTPAEEGGAGKMSLIEGGVFKDIDFALMAHPDIYSRLFPSFFAIGRVHVTYIGKEAHPASSPWEGVNALDAAVACYNNVALLRQHIKPTCRIHGIITNGGLAPNVVPGQSDLEFVYRAASLRDLEVLRKRFEQCCVSAAQATGCQIFFQWNTSPPCENLITNKVLAQVYGKYSKSMGVVFQDGDPNIMNIIASTDMGNVSHVVPSIHPVYWIGTCEAIHSKGYTEAAISPEAHKQTIIAAKSLALAAIEVICNTDLLKAIKNQFQEDIIADSL